MKTKIILSFALISIISLSCSTNPFTGKKNLNFVSNNQLFPMAFAQYDEFLSGNKVVTGTKDSERIKRIGQRISASAEKWLNANGHAGYLKDYRWEYNLVDDETVNAWCMPGGKIVFYTGILPIAANDAGIAAIMGHEVAHALADHGAQRMSAAQLQQIGAVGVAVATSGKDAQTQGQWMQAYGLGSTVGVMLPFSRKHETESDEIGILLMAIAGYDPAEAPELWKRMKSNSNGEAPPQILSTHPSSDSRIANLSSLVEKSKVEARKFGVTKFTR